MKIRIINRAGAVWLKKGDIRTVKKVISDRGISGHHQYNIDTGDMYTWFAEDSNFQILGIEPYYKALCNIK